ncbi:DNA adenine methylase [Gracilibacillus sp. S3-1-1]|uniref:DNA adenine methylase n=1 Tax=Gracilibacillus pellucidus TaxID=3095368 RepID=A0ACC6M3F5_9BACI|nr:DNA adenine methylase [Gracilibacillus sp. S3-1-1]MDX8045377.1 DNA adenine methylase [Gracilibacillus sp. S3-1-1]
MTDIEVKAKPFVKWAGGKRQLLSTFDELYPAKLKQGKIKRYVEPFVGGGAVFFDLVSKYDFEEIVLNDVNKILVTTYSVIKNDVDQLIDELESLQTQYFEKDTEERERYYYQIRAEFNELKGAIEFNSEDSDISRTQVLICSYFLFLNKTCFNGLYRENKKGAFNVPFGKYKNPKILDRENLLSIHKVLKKATLKSGDFESLTKYITKDTFVYLDPPYRPLNVTSSFSSYSKGDFNDDEQKRLAKWFREMSRTGAALMLSNSNPKNTNPEDTFFDELYEGFKLYDNIYASRAINSKASKRGAITELVVINEGEE